MALSVRCHSGQVLVVIDWRLHLGPRWKKEPQVLI